MYVIKKKKKKKSFAVGFLHPVLGYGLDGTRAERAAVRRFSGLRHPLRGSVGARVFGRVRTGTQYKRLTALSACHR